MPIAPRRLSVAAPPLAGDPRPGWAALLSPLLAAALACTATQADPPEAARGALPTAAEASARAADLPSVPVPSGWARSLGGRDREYASALAVDASGNVYAVGFFLGASDFGGAGPTLTSAGDADAFVVKLAPGGRLAWARRFGGRGQDEAKGVAVGPGGEVYVTGFFSHAAGFGPTGPRLESAGGSDVFVTRLDPSGAVTWARALGGAGADAGFAVAVDEGGDLYLTGSFNGEWEGADPPLTSAGSTDAWAGRFDPAGEPRWLWRFGGGGRDGGRALALAADGSVTVAGNFAGTTAAGKGCAALDSAGGTDVFLARLDGGGEALWCAGVGGPGTDSVEAVAVEGAGRLYAAGQFYGEADFDPGPGERILSSDGPSDGFLLALDPAGQLLAAHRLGGSGNDFVFGVAVGEPARPLVAGFELAQTRPGEPATESSSFLRRLGADGAAVAALRLSAEKGLQLFALAVDGAGTPHVAGVYKGIARFEVGGEPLELPAAGKVEAFVARVLLPLD